MMLAVQAAETVCADYGREIIGRAIKVSVFTIETSKNEWHYAEIIGHRCGTKACLSISVFLQNVLWFDPDHVLCISG